tara:strand:+ start:1366 stop:1710 length:345 start_codon:yes stop_codon:yes gene_type:complete
MNRYINNRPIGGNYFFIQKDNTKGKSLDFYLEHINLEDYHIYKYSRKQRIVTVDEFLKFKYAGYIFFRKSLYNKEDFNKWIEFISIFGGIMFLVKPFPSIEYLEKIKVCDEKEL